MPASTPPSPLTVPSRDADLVCNPGGTPGNGSEIIGLLRSIPGVSEVLHAITIYNIAPVTQLLERAAYFPLVVRVEGSGVQGAGAGEGAVRRLQIDTTMAGPGAAGSPAGPLAARNLVGGPVGDVRFAWRLVPQDYLGSPGAVQRVPPIPLLPAQCQRLEVYDWVLRFRGGDSGFRAYGMGHTLPGSVSGARATGVAFVLDVLEGMGELAGLEGTVIASGVLRPPAAFDLDVIVRFADPAGNLIASGPLTPLPPGAGSEPGTTTMAFLGQIDPAHPVTLRISLTEGVLGSNVFEQLRPADLGFDTGAGVAGGLRSRTSTGAVAGSVSARLSFDPLSLCPRSAIQTRAGVFEFHDPAGRSLGAVHADMTEGRAFRTRLPGLLLPAFRFGGFGPISGGSGEFAGARGIMTMNSIISVQPRTLSNLYVLRLDDPNGRYRAAARSAGGGFAR